MHYDVSMVKRGDWQIGIVLGALYTTRVDSANEKAAIKAAQVERLRYQKERYVGGPTGKANIDPTWQYCLPDELVPKGQRVAQAMGTIYYVGAQCRHHLLNHVRYTANRACAICQAEEQKGYKR